MNNNLNETSIKNALPGTPGGNSIRVLYLFWLFCDGGAPLVNFFTLNFMKMLPNVTFIIMVIKKVF